MQRSKQRRCAMSCECCESKNLGFRRSAHHISSTNATWPYLVGLQPLVQFPTEKRISRWPVICTRNTARSLTSRGQNKHPWTIWWEGMHSKCEELRSSSSANCVVPLARRGPFVGVALAWSMCSKSEVPNTHNGICFFTSTGQNKDSAAKTCEYSESKVLGFPNGNL